MSNVAFLTPVCSATGTVADSAAERAADSAALRERAPWQAPDGVFWSHGACLGASVILSTINDVDTLAQQIGQLPARSASLRPMAGQYLFMVKTLAAAWAGHSRPALLAACAALRHYGDSVGGRDAPALAGALQLAAGGRADGLASAARLVDGLVRRLAAPLACFADLQRDVASYLAQMAGASADLETDTVLVTQRLQADHVHAFILAQHIHTLRGKLQDARARREGCWLLGAEAGLARRDIATHGAALEQVCRQLDQLRSSQAEATAEAAWLQHLLPAVARFRGALERMGAGLQGTLDGVRALQAKLLALQDQLAGGAPAGAGAHAQLQAALPGWRALAARLAQLEPKLEPQPPGAA